jgi:hypothetical protein
MQIFNHRKKCWESFSANFTQSTRKKVYGLVLPVIPKQQLINYKKKNLEHADDAEAIS